MRKEWSPSVKRRSSWLASLKNKQTEKEADMPLIQVKAIEGVFSPEQKQEIVEKLTDTILAIGSEAMRPYTTVLIEEIASGSWAVGGTAFTTAGVKALGSGAK
jgi:4-oxalocrotonate tautomerase